MVYRNRKSFYIFVVIALYSTMFLPNPGMANDDSESLSLVISGGISLGAYESGLNWGLLKYLKSEAYQHAAPNSRRHAKLLGVSGASAGSINSLLSAIYWCVDSNPPGSGMDTVANNLLREVWRSVGFEDLLRLESENQSGKQLKKGKSLFNPEILDQQIEKIKSFLKHKTFKPGCFVPITISLTRVKPINIPISIRGSRTTTVGNSRFIVTIALVVDDKQKPHFVNYTLNRDNEDGMPSHNSADYGSVLYLPSENSENFNFDYYKTRKSGKFDIVKVEEVVKVVKASGAYPVAFSPVEITYCIDAYLTTNELQGNCRHGYIQDTAKFVDGGMLDNIPLRAAINLLPHEPEDTTFIFIDPDKIRETKVAVIDRAPSGADIVFDNNCHKNKQYDDMNLTGISALIEFLPHVVDSARKYELFTVTRDTRDLELNLWVTDRCPTLVGSSLRAFGAFLDISFRDYDYYAGVYDAAVNLAQRYMPQTCTSSRHPCFIKTLRGVYNAMGISSNNDAAWMFEHFLHKEYVQNEVLSAWPNQYHIPGNKPRTDLAMLSRHTELDIGGELVAVAEAVELLRKGEDDQTAFGIFLKHLKEKTQTAPVPLLFDKTITELLDLSDEELVQAKWYYPILSDSVRRLLEIDQEDGEYNGILSLSGYMLETSLAGNKTVSLQTSIPVKDQHYKNPYYYFPYELGFNVSGSGYYVSWEPRISLSQNKDCLWGMLEGCLYSANIGFGIGKLPHRDDGDMFEIWSVNPRIAFSFDGFNRKHFKCATCGMIVSSIGVGPGFTRANRQNDDGGNTNSHWSFFVGLFGDKIRFTRTKYADSFPGKKEEFFWYLSITDLSGLLYWIGQ